MEVAPINAQIVSGAVEDVLVARTYGQDLERGRFVARGDYLFAAIVDSNDGIDVEQHSDAMRSAGHVEAMCQER